MDKEKKSVIALHNWKYGIPIKIGKLSKIYYLQPISAIYRSKYFEQLFDERKTLDEKELHFMKDFSIEEEMMDAIWNFVSGALDYVSTPVGLNFEMLVNGFRIIQYFEVNYLESYIQIMFQNIHSKYVVFDKLTNFICELIESKVSLDLITWIIQRVMFDKYINYRFTIMKHDNVYCWLGVSPEEYHNQEYEYILIEFGIDSTGKRIYSDLLYFDTTTKYDKTINAKNIIYDKEYTVINKYT